MILIEKILVVAGVFLGLALAVACITMHLHEEAG